MIQGIDKPISSLALGTAFYRASEKEKWFRILDDYLRVGGTVIDTAPIYGDSEAIVGEWLETRDAREQVVIITKFGHGKGLMPPAEDLDRITTQELEKSLECLRTDYIDLYMPHRDNAAVPVGTIVERLNLELRRERVRAIGPSNWTYSRVDEANDYAHKQELKGFVAISNNLSLAVPTAPFWPGVVSTGACGVRWHERTRTPLISWSAQARGFFTGQYTPEQREQASNRASDAFAEKMIEIYCTDDNLERLRRAEELGEKKGGYSAVQISLAWLMHKSFPLVPVVGPHTREELASCVQATSLQLSDRELRWLNLEA